jgi:hypothetical protein
MGRVLRRSGWSADAVSRTTKPVAGDLYWALATFRQRQEQIASGWLLPSTGNGPAPARDSTGPAPLNGVRTRWVPSQRLTDQTASGVPLSMAAAASPFTIVAPTGSLTIEAARGAPEKLNLASAPEPSASIVIS